MRFEQQQLAWFIYASFFCCFCCCFCFLINYCWHHFEGVVARCMCAHYARLQLAATATAATTAATAFATATSLAIFTTTTVVNVSSTSRTYISSMHVCVYLCVFVVCLNNFVVCIFPSKVNAYFKISKLVCFTHSVRYIQSVVIITAHIISKYFNRARAVS